ncbi:hypothetical protein KAU33_01835 [Candidatus Dependentiae bacterium]|nr:hypothetical protein [Candidatus Dependentiae bacterium]
MTQDNLQPPLPNQDFSVMPASLITARIVIQIYGWFLMIISVGAALVLFSMGILAFFQGGSDGVAAGFALFGFGIFLIIFFGGIGFTANKAGKAIKERKNWGRIFGIILAILSVGIFPIGTLAAVFIFIGLFSRESEGWFID